MPRSPTKTTRLRPERCSRSVSTSSTVWSACRLPRKSWSAMGRPLVITTPRRDLTIAGPAVRAVAMDGQLRAPPLHLARVDLAFVELAAAPPDPAQQIERVRIGQLPRGDQDGSEREAAAEDLGLGQVERVRALDVPGGEIVAARVAVDR